MKSFLVALICLLLLVSPVVASEGTIVIGVSTGYPPYYYKQDGKLTGLCVEITTRVIKKIGMEPEYKEFPWKRLILSAQRGDVDAIMPLFKTKEREEFLHFGGLDLAFEKDHFFTLTGSPVSYLGSFEQIAEHRIGVVEGYSYGKKFDNFQFPKKTVTLDDKHLIEMLINKRIDIGVGNKYVVEHYAELAGVANKIQFLDPSLSEEVLYLGFAKKAKTDALAEKFAATLKRFKATAEYQHLTKKYGIDGYE